MGGFATTAASGNYVLTVEKVIAKLQNMDSIIFTLSPLGELNGFYDFPPSGPIDPPTR